MSVAVTGLTTSYGPRRVLQEVTLTAADGRVTGFLGPNGAGKTTTMRCLLGLVSPDSGSALVDGRSHRDLDRPASRVGALLSQDAHHPGRTGRSHLRVLAAAAALPRSRVDEVLREVELERAADRTVGTYSLGMRQRLHLAGALLGDPSTLVLDEPTNGLDPSGARWLRDRLRAFAAEGRCVLLSSHVLGEVSRTVDDVCVIAAGRVVGAGTLEEVLGESVPRTLVRTTEPERLSALLVAAGAVVDRHDEGSAESLRVGGMDAEDVAATALEHRILVTRLHPVVQDLESRFLALTSTEPPPDGPR